MRRVMRLPAATFLLSMTLAVTGCQMSAGNTGTKVEPHQVVLLTPALPASLNPLAGFDNNGTGKINESLFTLSGPPDALPQIIPLLAREEPSISADGLQWTVKLQQQVRFSDGSALDSADVVASYRAIMDPASASPLAGTLQNLLEVQALDASTVRFTLAEPQASFQTSLLIGIAPSELVTPGEQVSTSALNRTPIGTGPYLVEEFTASRLVFGANPDYRGGAPEVSRVIYELAADDNARAQRMAAGGYTGTVLPPRLAAGLAQRPEFEAVTATSADWRGISLPAEHPFTQDPNVRLALNLAVDRAALIDGVLAGAGRPAHTFVPPEYGAAYEPQAIFEHNPQLASELLDAAGWVKGSTGIRQKDGIAASFSIMYNPGDTLRRDLALALSAQLHSFGIEADVEAATFEKAEPRMSTAAIMLGGGDTPYDVDSQLYKMLHSSYPDAGSYYENPSRYRNPTMDAALHTGRVSTDAGQRDAAYRQVQRLHVQEPSMLLLAFIDHTYVQSRAVHEVFTTTDTLLEPHEHGTAWGPWVRIDQWTSK